MSQTSQPYNPFTYQFSFSQIALSFLQEKSQYEPTEVLLFKKVPYNASELDVLELCKPFGSIEDICFIKSKGYAFIQFQETKSAQLCYETFNVNEPTIKNSKLYVFYTGKREITKPESSSTYPSRFVVISMASFIEEINSEFLEKLVRQYGHPLKMLILQESPFSAVIEMKNIEEAIRLKEGLNNFEITKISKITTSFASGKTFNMMQQGNTPRASLGRSCTSIENSVVSSPVYTSGESTLETFTDAITDSRYSFSRSNSEEYGSRTVMIKNLPENTTCDDLFRLFGMYGNILKVKIFYKATDTALVQFQDTYQANLAKKFLNNCPFEGSSLLVSFSKTDINTSGGDNSDFFKDYTHQKGQRYRKLGSKNFRNIAQPSKVLHLSNLDPGKNLTFYVQLFASCGTIVKYMGLAGESPTVLIEMGDLQEAVRALVKFHNCEIEGKYLKVSFSKYDNIKYL